MFNLILKKHLKLRWRLLLCSVSFFISDPRDELELHAFRRRSWNIIHDRWQRTCTYAIGTLRDRGIRSRDHLLLIHTVYNKYKFILSIHWHKIKMIMSTLFRNNPQNGQQLIINDKSSVDNSFWNPEHPTTIYVHGWQGNTKPGSSSTLIRDGRIAIHLNCSNLFSLISQ